MEQTREIQFNSLSSSPLEQVMNNRAPNHQIDLKLKLGDEDYWKTSTKSLVPSDVDPHQSRLLWPVQNFPTNMPQNLVEQCRTIQGKVFEVVDVDTQTNYLLTFKQWRSGSYVWTNHWIKNFVERRKLNEHDVIGLLFDDITVKFYFSVRGRA